MNYKIAFWIILVILIAWIGFSFFVNDKFLKDIDEMDKKVQQLEQEKRDAQPPPPAPVAPTPAPTPQPEVVVDKPKANSILPNKVDIVGRAKGNWFFEANIVCKIIDGQVRQIGIVGCQATENWMQEDYVDFTGTIWIRGDSSTYPLSKTGWLIIENDNPSGDPKNLKQFKVPVRFK